MERTDRQAHGTLRFWTALTAIGGIGLVVRVVDASTRGALLPITDPNFYHLQANLLADGHGFADPFIAAFQGYITPTAAHPPLFSLALSIASTFGITSVAGHRIVGCLLGAAAVVAIGLLGRRVASDTVGRVAAAFAALYPGFWIIDANLFSESLVLLLVPLLLLASYRFIERPGRLDAVVIGLLTGLLVLTRSELFLFVPFLVLPLCLRRPTGPTRRRVGMAALMIVVAAATVAPWVIRNTVVYDRVLLTTNGDFFLSTANCDGVYSGERIGWFDAGCIPPRLVSGSGESEASRAAAARAHAFRYMRDHAATLAGRVVWARLGRQWDVYRPLQTAQFEVSEGRPSETKVVAVLAFYALAFAAAFGVVAMRGRIRWPLLVPLLVASITVVLVAPNVRLRAVAEPGLVVFAAFGVVTLAAWLQARRSAPGVASH